MTPVRFVPLLAVSVLLLLLLEAGLPVVFALTYVHFGQSTQLTTSLGPIGRRNRAGLQAAFKEINDNGGINGLYFQLTSKDDKYDPELTLNNTFEYANDSTIVALIGGTGTPTTVAVDTYLPALNLVNIAPFTGSSYFRRTFRSRTVNLRAGYDDEAYTMLNLLLNREMMRRIGILYQNDGFGIPAKNAIVSALNSLHIDPVMVMGYERDALMDGTMDMGPVVQEILKTRCQGVILYSVVEPTSKVITEIRKRTSQKIILVGGSFVGSTLGDELKANQVTPKDLYITQILPHPLSNKFNLTKNFRKAILALEGPTAVQYDGISFEGYVNGRFAAEIVRRMPTVTRDNMYTTVYQSRLFQVDDLLLGPYSDDCTFSTEADGRSSLCYCNQGNRKVYTISFNDQYEYTEFPEELSYPMTECYATESLLKRPLAFSQAYQKEPTAAATLRMGMLLSQKDLTVLETPVSTDSVAAGETINTLMGDLLLTGFAAGISEELNTTFPVIGQLQIPERASGSFKKNHVQILSTFEQQLYVFFEYIKNVTSANDVQVVILYRDDMLTSLEVARSAAYTHSVPITNTLGFGVATPVALSLTARLASMTYTSGHLIVLGAESTADFTSLFSYVESNILLNLYVPFAELAINLNRLGTSFVSLPNRTLFATNLPHWKSTDDPFVKSYMGSTTTAGTVVNKDDPLTFVGYACGIFIKTLLDRGNVRASPVDFLSLLYSTSVITVGERSFGPYLDRDCIGPSCKCNSGSRDVTLYSLSGIEKKKHVFDGCNAVFAVPSSSSNNAAALGGIIAAVLAVVLIVIIIAIVVVKGRGGDARDTAYAPTEGDITLMFTDIQSSTRLWGTCPACMSMALDNHHSIIRECIQVHKGYEVKTVGDSFMIAVGDTNAAVELANDIQRKLQKIEFPKAIKEVYKAETPEDLDCIDDNPEELEEIDPLWNGILVRIGIHVGKPDVHFDTVAKGYDYYGPAVNLAARVESAAQGGQICVTRDVVNKLSINDGFVVSHLGHVELKGVSEPIELLQISPVELHARIFAKLELATDAGVVEGDVKSIGSAMSTTSDQTQQNAVNEEYLSFLNCLLKIMKPKDKSTVVDLLGKSWRISLSKNAPKEDQLREIVRRAGHSYVKKEMKRRGSTASNLSNHSKPSGTTTPVATNVTTPYKPPEKAFDQETPLGGD